jgi:hypothetical protein
MVFIDDGFRGGLFFDGLNGNSSAMFVAAANKCYIIPWAFW